MTVIGRAVKAIAESSCHGSLEIDGVLMGTKAWAVLNLFELWHPAQVRGNDITIPGLSGVIPNTRRRAATVRSLNIIVVGICDKDGVVHADPIVGLELNLKYLADNVIAPVNTTAGTRPITLSMPSGAVRTGDAHVQAWTVSIATADCATAVLDLSFPAGELAGTEGS